MKSGLLVSFVSLVVAIIVFVVEPIKKLIPETYTPYFEILLIFAAAFTLFFAYIDTQHRIRQRLNEIETAQINGYKV